MSDLKSKKIQRISHELSLIEDNLEKVEIINKLPFTDIVIYNGSGKKEKIMVDDSFKPELITYVKQWYLHSRNELRKELKDSL